ncbi:MAG: regulator of chromosome condensation 1/beta-lactamase-inhibitor protein II [Piptocephalis tieghemiana]|nr:MAG: regulator of chromosome condensation 1/beta-lactamase-inhibitor protein II [Piptocephalis tieghemiana]KAI9226147.1 MAG: regulator of chromosome condensation 1/beta-lactamase-inhibitor protein II [Piptocephalis tieghemiana]
MAPARKSQRTSTSKSASSSNGAISVKQITQTEKVSKRPKPQLSASELVEKARKKLPARERKLPILTPLPGITGTVGKVMIFGTGEQGALGLGEDRVERKKPTVVEGLEEVKAVDVIGGGSHCAVLGQEGKVWTWGTSDAFAIGRLTQENASDMIKAFKQMNRIQEAQELQARMDSSSEEFPTEWTPGPSFAGLPQEEGVKVVRVAAGDCTTAVITSLGTLYVSGIFRGGDGNIRESVQPEFTLITELLPHTIVDVACGNNHILALTDRGFLYAWGSGEQMQFGRRTTDRRVGAHARLLHGIRPERVPLTDVVTIGAGGYHSMAVTSDGTLYTWGMNSYGQCGLGKGSEDRIGTPEPVDPSVFGGRRVTRVAGGEQHTVVVCEDGSTWACGRADSGQTGLSAEDRQDLEMRNDQAKSSALPSFAQIPALKDCQIQGVACGTHHTAAVDSSGTAWCWGYAEQWATGTADEEDTVEPTKLTGSRLVDRRVLRIGAGGHHTILLASLKEDE